MSRGQTLAGLAPFLCYGGIMVMFDLVRLGPSPQPPYVFAYLTMSSYVIAVMLMPLIGLGIGSVKAFPTWAYPYLGVAAVLALFQESQPIPGITVFGYTLLSSAPRPPELLGWRAWLPLLTISAVVLLVTRSIYPLRCLVSGIWRDWTKLSFALYGVLPLALWVVFDEVAPGYRLLFMLIVFTVLLLGALAYLRSGRMLWRALALTLPAAIATSLAMVGSALYWHGVQWLAWPPTDGYGSVLGGLGACVALLLAPALLGVLRRVLEMVRGDDTCQVSSG